MHSDQPPGQVEARLDRLRGRAQPVNHNDPAKATAAAIQSAVYVHVLVTSMAHLAKFRVPGA